MGPAGLESTCSKVWSLAVFSVKTTVVSSGAATLSTFARSDEGPLPLSAPLAGRLGGEDGERVAVRELQVGLERDGELVVRGVLAALRDVGLDVGAAVGAVEQEREDLVLHRERAVVVRAGGVERQDLVGRADDDRSAAGCAAVLGERVAGSAGAAGEDEGRGGESGRGEQDA
jgi:hypothetical protein